MKANRSLDVTVLVGSVAVVFLGCISARADFTFGPAQNLGPTLNTTSGDGAGGTTSADGLELYFCSGRAGGFGEFDIWVSKRQSINDAWGPPTNLGATVNSAYGDSYPSLFSDGLTLYFSDSYSSMSATSRPGGVGGPDIWITTRPSRDAPWTAPVNPGEPVNSSSTEISPTISADGLTLVVTSTRAGGRGSWDLWMSTRASARDAWGLPVNLGPNINSAGIDGECSLSADGLALFFLSDRAGGLGAYDLWMTTRKSVIDPWGPAVNSASEEGSAGVSADMRTLYFTSNRPGGLGGYDLWQAPILPVVDFDGDGAVGMGDLLRLIQSWDQDDPAVDMGPGPWGDGKVDADDLEVLMGYWGQGVYDPMLMAYWKLDETSGTTAADSAGSNDGTLAGDPTWQPADGRIGGALLFDGSDDYVTTEFVLDPSKGPFSVFAWIKGGAPGQVILSQTDGANWLVADAVSGALATELKSGGRFKSSLLSKTVITDGEWHRVGLVLDGADRSLYVDGVEAAKDTQPAIAPSINGLYIGAGSKLTAGAFWSGLIDDVRIYNKAVKPGGK